MCKVSDKLKLCTCEFDPDTTKNYWEFSRYNAKKDEYIIGQPMLPIDINPEDDTFNRQLITRLLNEGNVFDVELNPKNKDRLYLSFQINNHSWNNRVYYGYVFKKGKWIEHEFDTYEWYWRHDEEKSGKILDAIKED